MTTLPKPLKDTVNSVMQAVSKQSMQALGSTSADGKTTQPITPLSRDEAQAIARLQLWNSPTQTQLDKQSLRKLLSQGLLPPTREDATYWIARLLQHFPSRQTERDAIIISDLADDVLYYKLSHVGLIDACDQIRRDSSSDNPFMPPSGEVISVIKSREYLYRIALKSTEDKPKVVSDIRPALEKPRYVPVPWRSLTYKQAQSANLISNIITHCEALGHKKEDYLKYLHSHWGFPKKMEDWR